MFKTKWIAWVIGTSLVGSGLLTLPTHAIPNQSDITGNNIWNSVAPIFKMNGKLDPEILRNARRLAKELDEVSASCGNASVPMGPRRFARRPGQVALSPDCQRLSRLVEETKTFLNDVNRMQMEQRSASRNRTW